MAAIQQKGLKMLQTLKDQIFALSDSFSGELFMLTRASSNRKTGPIPVSTSNRRSCPPTCPFLGAGCYGDGGPLAIHWNRLTDRIKGMSAVDFLLSIAKLPAGQLWRHNQAGDLLHFNGAIIPEFVHALVAANRGRRGFTFSHHLLNIGENLNLLRFANANGFKINASCETESQADSAIAQGLPAVVVVDSEETRKGWKTEGGNKVVVCPAQTQNDMSCDRCKLCQKRPPNLIVAFLAHGMRKRMVNASLSGIIDSILSV